MLDRHAGGVEFSVRPELITPHFFHVFLGHLDVVKTPQMAFSHDFRCRVTGELFHAFIEDEHVSLGVDHDDSVHDALDQFFKKGPGPLGFPLKSQPLRDVSRGFQKMDQLTLIVIDRGQGDHVEVRLPVLVLVLAVVAEEAFFFDLVEPVGDGTRFAVGGAGFVQAVSHFVAVLSHGLLPMESIFLKKGAVDGIDRHIHGDDHDPVGKGVQDQLGLFPAFLFNRLLLSFKIGFRRLDLNQVPEKTSRFVIHDGNAGRSLRVDLILKSGDPCQFDDEVQTLKTKEIFQPVGHKEIQALCVPDSGSFGAFVKNPQDLDLEAREALCVEEVQEI